MSISTATATARFVRHAVPEDQRSIGTSEDCLLHSLEEPTTRYTALADPLRDWDRHCVDAIRVVLGLELLYLGRDVKRLGGQAGKQRLRTRRILRTPRRAAAAIPR